VASLTPSRCVATTDNMNLVSGDLGELTPSEIEFLSSPITSKYIVNKVIGSPFNRARFIAIPPLSIDEMSSILSSYEKGWIRFVPDKLKCLIMSESGEHAASLMSLVLYHERHPAVEAWPLQVQKYYVHYMNGVQAKILADLQDDPGLLDTVKVLISHGSTAHSM
jgi:hypothetical protein